MHVNPALELAGGRALGRAGDTPICIVNETGRGRAILLNFTIWSYPNTAVHGKNEDAAGFMSALFSAAGAKRPLEILDEAGLSDKLDGLEVVFVSKVVLFVWEGDVDFSGSFRKFLKSLNKDLQGLVVGCDP